MISKLIDTGALMRASTIDCLSNSDCENVGSLRLEQRSGVATAVMFLMVLVPALIAVVAPMVMLLSLALTDPAARAVLGDKAGSVLLVALGFGISATLLGIPAMRFLGQIGAKRIVEISDGDVRVVDRSIMGRRSWSCPLGAYSGVMHAVRTTLSGARHELVLVHVEPQKSVLLHVAPAISHDETVQMAQMFGQIVLSAPVGSVRKHPRRDVVNVQPAQELKPLAA